MSFETELATEIGVIKKNVGDGVRLVADEIFVNLCNNSPTPGFAPFSLGSYVLSHRINGGSADTSITEITNENRNAIGEAMSNELPKLDYISPFQTIVISNSIDYNENIEYLGWSTGTGPYHTFKKTEGTMENIAQQAMDRII